MKKNLISIIIPSYNSANTLPRAIISAHQQNVAKEIIVIDDNSEDDIDAVFHELKYIVPDLRMIRSKSNMGAAGARNLGIAHAKGEFLAFLDADDAWLPEKLVKQRYSLESDKSITLVSSDSVKLTPYGEVMAQGHKNKPPVSGPEAWKTLLRYNFCPTPTVFTYTNLVREVGGFDESLEVAEDLDLWIKLGRKGSIAIIDEVLVHYFDYSHSLMKSMGPKSSAKITTMIQGHIDSDDRIDDIEAKNILAQRYFELGVQCLNFNVHDDAEEYFSRAIVFGYPKQPINALRMKRRIKHLIGKH